MALLNFLMERLDHPKGRRNGLLSAPFSRSQRWSLTRHGSVSIPSSGDETTSAPSCGLSVGSRRFKTETTNILRRSSLVKNKMQSQSFSSLAVKQNMGAASGFNNAEEPNTCILTFGQQEPPKMVAKRQKKCLAVVMWEEP